MALKNIHYGEIKNVNSKNNKVLISVDSLIESLVDAVLITRHETVFIAEGRYDNVGQLLSAMQTSLDTFLKRNYPLQKNKCYLNYAMSTNKWTLKLPVGVTLEKTNKEPNLTQFFTFPIGYYNSIQLIGQSLPEKDLLGFLYCSVIENSYINTRASRLMASIPLKSKSGFSQHEFVNPYYYAIAISDFSSIEFELRDGEGDLIDFTENAYLVLNLHVKTGI